MKLRTAVIVDQLNVSKWQLDALNEAKDQIEIVYILNCTNTKNKKNLIKNFFYYVLSYLCLKNKQTKKQEFHSDGAETIHFDSIYNKSWQTIPNDVVKKLQDSQVEMVIKFGMGLLRIDDALSKCNILSYHHGDPSKYRGRPAGFYEILNGAKKSGVIVQKLTNQLDAGSVYAFAESKVVGYSYKKTALNFYSISKYLLPQAITNLNTGRHLEISTNGNNYRLPSNPTVVLFTLKMASRLIQKILYGLFYEKRWKVAVGNNSISLDGSQVLSKESLNEVPITDEYNFYADPFFSTDGRLLRLEALGKSSGLGDIIEIDINDLNDQRVLLDGQHYSYPYAFDFQDTEYLMPEVASHSSQYILALNPNNETQIPIQGFENKRIVDGTLHQKDGFWYLFFGLDSNAHTVLNLWVADDPRGTFAPHPASPICISPSMARMGGGITMIGDKLFRFGQNNEGEYGESLSVLEIQELTPNTYVEAYHGSISMKDVKGPHSLNLSPDKKSIVIDYYEDRFSFFAGFRRIKAKLSKR